MVKKDHEECSRRPRGHCIVSRNPLAEAPSTLLGTASVMGYPELSYLSIFHMLFSA